MIIMATVEMCSKRDVKQRILKVVCLLHGAAGHWAPMQLKAIRHLVAIDYKYNNNTIMCE